MCLGKGEPVMGAKNGRLYSQLKLVLFFSRLIYISMSSILLSPKAALWFLCPFLRLTGSTNGKSYSLEVERGWRT